MDDIRAELPDEPPLKCPKCDYVGATKHVLLVHYGITHRIVVKYIDDAIKKDPTIVQVVQQTTLPSSSSRSRQKARPELSDKERPFKCPMCSLSITTALRKNHLCRHFKDKLLVFLPSKAPFHCPKSDCKFVGLDLTALMTHYGGFHGLVDQYLKDVLATTKKADQEEGETTAVAAVTEENVTSNAAMLSETTNNKSPPPTTGLECRLCEPGTLQANNVVLRHNADFYKHLAEVHFLENILEEVLHDVPYNTKPFRCNQPGCEYSSMNRAGLVPHVGVFHKFAVKYYYQVMGNTDDWTKAEVGSVGRGGVADWSTSSSRINARLQNSAPVVPVANQTCPVCQPPAVFTHVDLLTHLAKDHFSDQLLALGISESPPFKCPRCPYCSEKYLGILKHFLTYHKQMEALTAQVLGRPMPPAEVKEEPQPPEVNGVGGAPNAASQGNKCYMCDDIKFIAGTQGDFFKHLVENHFRERLMADIPGIDQVVEGTNGEAPTTKKVFRCPFPDCGYDHTYKWLVAKHWGTKHRMAIAFYEEVTGQSRDVLQPNKPQVKATTSASVAAAAAAASLPQSVPHQQQPPVPQQQFDQTYHPPHQPEPVSFSGAFSNNSNPVMPRLLPEPQPPQQPPPLPPQKAPVVIPLTSRPPQPQYPPSILQNLDQEARLGYDMNSPPYDAFGNGQARPYADHNASSSGMEDSMSSSADQTFSGTNDDSLMSNDGNQTFDCKLCSVKSRGMSEYLKHLSKVHFKHKLLSSMPKTPPFKCPWNGCEVSKKDRFNLALHYGMSHKIALKLIQEMPEDALDEDVEATCKLCHESFTAHRYLYTHLSDTHFQADLDRELPTASPWKCPKCPYTGNDPRALRIHYGVRHKMVLNHLAIKLGVNINVLRKEMKANRKKAVSALKATMGCKFCSTQFKTAVEQAKHVVQHLKNELSKDLPPCEPFKCPKCELVAADRPGLLMHYGLSHAQVVQELLERDPSTLAIDMSFVCHEPPGLESPPAANQPMAALQRQQLEDKKFPKCRICNYRYFTRLDLCRHFVDFHLRDRLASCLDPCQTRCPACTLTYERRQSRLRHFIWSHQDLEALVMETKGVRLSEFMPSTRDLEIVKQKNERKAGGDVMHEELKDITDLAALPVNHTIDVKLSIPSCELCGEEFKHSVNKARDKGVHLLGHFREEVVHCLPMSKPFKCPKCSFLGRDLVDLSRHYGLSHRVVFHLMQKELGDEWMVDENDENECRVCSQVFPNNRVLVDHYCTQHFYNKIAENLPTEHPFKCNQCAFLSKTQLALIRHVGTKHKMVKTLLTEEGYFLGSPASVKRSMSTTSQDSSLSQPTPPLPQHPHPQVQLPQQPVVYQPDPQYQGWDQQQQQYPPPPPPQQQQHQPYQDQHYLSAPPYQPQQGYQQQQQPYQQHLPPPPQQQQPTPPMPNNLPLYNPNKNEGKQSKNDSAPVACPICHSTFLNSTHFLRHSADKHFFDRLRQDLPPQAPFKCPYCTFEGKDVKLLARHYGLNHRMVLKYLNERAGKLNCFDESILKSFETTESNREACPLCSSNFAGRYMLLRHLADCHFRERLCQGMQSGELYKCPKCNHESKDKGGFVRHYGLVHKMVQKWLKEMGINGYDEDPKKVPKVTAHLQQQPPQQHKMDGGNMDLYQDYQRPPDYDPYYENPASFPPPSTPSSTTSYADQMQQQQAFNNQYYSSPPTINTQFETPNGGLPSSSSQYSPAPNVRPPSQPPSRPFSNASLTSPLPQPSPQNLQPPVTPGGSSYDSYYGQAQDLSRAQQPVDYSGNQYYGGQPQRPVNGMIQQPMTPQTPQPSITPQPMTPQPMTPGSHDPATPQSAMTPQDPSMQSTSPGYNAYETQNNIRQPIVPHMPGQPPPQQAPQQPGYPVSRPVTLQPQDPPHAVKPRNQMPVPPGDEFIMAPEPSTPGPYAIKCSYCTNITKNKSDFYRHLSERHFKAELAKELPTVAPFKCPVHTCNYETKDNTVAPLVKHYGIVHKAVHKFLRGQIAGRYIHHDPRKTVEHHQPIMNGMSHEQQPIQTISNEALKVKCPFCESMFAARYGFYQHLCDRHFKDALAKQVPLNPPFQCPVSGCGYVARDSRQSLVRHFGMTHKVVVELLKRYAPDYNVNDHSIPAHDDNGMVQPEAQIPQQQPQQQQAYYQDQQYQMPMQQQQFQPQQQYQPPQDYLLQPINSQPPLPQQPYLPPPQQQQQPVTTTSGIEPQIDGTFDPSHYSDHSSSGGDKSIPTTPIKTPMTQQNVVSLKTSGNDSLIVTLAVPEGLVPPKDNNAMATALNSVVEQPQNKAPAPLPPPSKPAASTPTRGAPKVCEICGKQFDGKNRAMLKVQHMAHHFKQKLFADLVEKSPPYKCPVKDCAYQTKHKPDWARHYGSVHHFINKYLKDFLDERERLGITTRESEFFQVKVAPSQLAAATAAPMPQTPPKPMVQIQNSVSDGERTYSAFLPKENLSAIISTALDQQSQPQRNFGVVTVTGPVVQQIQQQNGMLPAPNGFQPQQQQQQHPHQQQTLANGTTIIQQGPPAQMPAMPTQQPPVQQDVNLVMEQVMQHATKIDPQTGIISQPNFNHRPQNILTEALGDLADQIKLEESDPTKGLDLLSSDMDASFLANDNILEEALASAAGAEHLPDTSLLEDGFGAVQPPTTSASSTIAASVPRSATGRPCEICGFEPKTKNKSRERQDHLAMKHYRDRIQSDLANVENFVCPLCEYVGKDKQTIYRHYTGKHKVVEQYLADDIASGKVIPLAVKQQQALPNLPTTVEPLPSFDLDANVQPQGTSLRGSGIDLTIHSLVDSPRLSLTDLMDTEPMNGVQDRIMQVDGCDDEDDDELLMQVDGTTGNELDFLDDDISNMSNGSTSSGREDVPCPICDEPTKLHKTYHLATKHFKNRLLEILPDEKPFRCPECAHESKTKINMWTHYLGKHRYGNVWTKELQDLRQNGYQSMMLACNQPSVAAPVVNVPPVANLPPPIKTEPVVPNVISLLPPPLAATIKKEVKEEPQDIAENSIVDEMMVAPCSTPISAEVAFPSSRSKSKADNFWCDLCQAIISNVFRIHHYAGVHFVDKLQKILPVNGPFICPVCRHEGKHFFNLSVHFLGKHNLLDSWLRKALEKIEDEAIAKAVVGQASGGPIYGGKCENKRSKHYISSGEETDTNVRSEDT